MKRLNFPDDTNIFLLRGINCYTRIQSILKSHEKASTSFFYIRKIFIRKWASKTQTP